MEQEVIYGLLIGLVIGFIYMHFKTKNKIILEKTVKISNFPMLFTEIYNDVILAYNNKTNDFVCQGKTLQEVVDNLKHRKIHEAFLIHDNDGSKNVYFIKNGTLKLIPT